MTLSQSKKNNPTVNYMYFSANQKKSIRKSIGMTGRITKKIAQEHGFKSVDQFYNKHHNKIVARKSKLRKLKKEKHISERKIKFHVTIMTELVLRTVRADRKGYDYEVIPRVMSIDDPVTNDQFKDLSILVDIPIGYNEDLLYQGQTNPGCLPSKFGTKLIGGKINEKLDDYYIQLTVVNITKSKIPTVKPEPMEFLLQSASPCQFSSCTDLSAGTGECVIDTLHELLKDQLRCKRMSSRENLINEFGEGCLKSGVSANQILVFCRKYLIPCRFLDVKNNLIAMNVVERHGKHTHNWRPCLFFKIVCKHLYVIENVTVRDSLKQHNTLTAPVESNVVYKSQMDLKLFNKSLPTESILLSDITNKSITWILAEHPNTFIICDVDCLFELHCEYMTEYNKCFDYHVKIDSGGKLKKFGDFGQNIIWISIPNYKQERGIYKQLFLGNEINYTIMSSRQSMILKSFDFGCAGSTFNLVCDPLRTKTPQVFHFDYPQTNPIDESMVRGLDFSKFYTSCMYESDHDFLIFNELCYPVQMLEKHVIQPDCVYYVDRLKIGTRFYSGPDYYYPELIQYWLDEQYITLSDITHYIKAERTIPVSKFKRFVKNMYSLFQNDLSICKDLINKFIGCMRMSSYKSPNIYFTDDQGDVDVVMYDSKSASVQEHGDKHMVLDYIETTINQTFMTVHQQILDISAMKLSKLENHLVEEGCRVTKVKTDCLWYELGPNSQIDLELFDRPSDPFRNKHFKLKYEITSPILSPHLQVASNNGINVGWDNEITKWSTVNELEDERTCGTIAHHIDQLMIKKDSFYLGGGGGYGKSYLVDTVIKKYPDLHVLGSTHRAYLQVEGEDTLDAFKMKQNISLKNKRILVDEISMSNPAHMIWLYRQKQINNIQLILVGDFNQCTVDESMKDFINHPLFIELCDNNRVEMKFNKREIQSTGKPTIHRLVQKIFNNKSITADVTNRCTTYNNLVWFHTTRSKLNTAVNDQYNKKRTGGSFECTLEGKTTEIRQHTRLICKRPVGLKTTSWSKYKKMGLYNNAFYLIDRWDDQNVIILKEDKTGIAKYGMRFKDEIKIPLEYIDKYFRLGWSFTTHSVQGMSIDSNMTIWNVKQMERSDRSILYTAVSRCTEYKYLHFGDDSCLPETGNIYMITDKTTGQRYIGSTKHSIKHRFEQHVQASLNKKATSQLMCAMRANGVKNFTIKLIKSYTIPGGIEELLEKERYWMEFYDTIKTGLNQQLP